MVFTAEYPNVPYGMQADFPQNVSAWATTPCVQGKNKSLVILPDM